MMAGTLGRLTGRPGICFVTRGPGATNAAHGVHIAEHDSAPMILFVGQVERAMRGRGAFQEMDYRALFGSTTKWVAEIEIAGANPGGRPARLSLRHAGPARPGRDLAARGRADRNGGGRRRAARRSRPDLAGPDADGGIAEAAVGGRAPARHRRRPRLDGEGERQRAALRRALRPARRRAVPPRQRARRRAPELLRRDRPRHQPEAEGPRRKRRPRAADRRPHVGGGVAELYAVRHSRRRGRRSIHVHADPHEIGRNYAPTLGIIATSPAFAAALEAVQPPTAIAVERGDARRRAPTISPGASRRRARPAPCSRPRSCCTCAARSPDAIFTTGAGNFALWVNRFLRFRTFEQQLGPTGGSMGYGLPAAIAAKQLYPERVVVAFAGDGDFLMNGQEFATAVQYGLAVIVDRHGQWPVRHDPHASGARISRPRRRHAAAQPGFRGARPRLRRPRRDGRAHRGVRAGLRARARRQGRRRSCM